MSTFIDPKLREFCTNDHQRNIFDACVSASSARDAARKSDYSLSTIKSSVSRPNIDAQRQEEMMQAAIASLCETIKKEKPVPAPKHSLEDLLSLYVITDYHIGMKAWGEETRGDNWDTKIAEDMLYRWFKSAIKSSPDSQTAVFAQMGDFLHWEGMDAVTPMNRNILDADGRIQMIIRVALRAIRRIVRELLIKHKTLHLIMAEGNHDPAGSAFLRESLNMLYEDEPRVFVDVSPDPYYCYEHGFTSLFFHHGHKKKMTNIDDVFVAKFREVFGRTKFSYGHMGHLHHRDMKETNLMVLEQHRTLAAHDQYASSHGWVSGREAQSITYSKKYGEVGRVVVTPEMIG